VHLRATQASPLQFFRALVQKTNTRRDGAVATVYRSCAATGDRGYRVLVHPHYCVEADAPSAGTPPGLKSRLPGGSEPHRDGEPQAGRLRHRRRGADDILVFTVRRATGAEQITGGRLACPTLKPDKVNLVRECCLRYAVGISLWQRANSPLRFKGGRHKCRPYGLCAHICSKSAFNATQRCGYRLSFMRRDRGSRLPGIGSPSLLCRGGRPVRRYAAGIEAPAT